MMKIKNTGSTRIRLDKVLYLKPGQVLEVPNAEGKLIIRKHTDVINVTPKKPKITAKPKFEYKKLDLNIEVKKDDIR